MLYDAAGRRTRLTWSDGRYVTFAYNGASDLTAILESGTTSLAAFAYDDVGRRSTLTRGNGVVTTYSGYTPLGVGSLFHDLTGTANDVTFAYSYNPAGQISTELGTPTAGNPILRRYVFGPGGDEPIIWYEGADFTTKRYMIAGRSWW